jgi:hypothetical protein
MRWVVTFILMAVVFGLGTEFLTSLRTGEYSFKLAAIRGLGFAVPVTAFTYYQDKRKTK